MNNFTLHFWTSALACLTPLSRLPDAQVAPVCQTSPLPHFLLIKPRAPSRIPAIYTNNRENKFITINSNIFYSQSSQNMNRSLKERAFLNLSLEDVLYPYRALGIKPNASYFLEEVIFRVGKNMIIDQLISRDEGIEAEWPDLNNHHCLISEGINGPWCWCSCDTTRPTCRCVCFAPLFILIKRIEEVNGPINRQAKMKYILSNYNA